MVNGILETILRLKAVDKDNDLIHFFATDVVELLDARDRTATELKRRNSELVINIEVLQDKVQVMLRVLASAKEVVQFAVECSPAEDPSDRILLEKIEALLQVGEQ
jgi:hypothetical protein